MTECVPDFHIERGKNFCFNLNENQKVKTRQHSTIVKYVSKILFDSLIDISQHFQNHLCRDAYENGPIYSYFAYNVRKNTDIRDVENFLAM